MKQGLPSGETPSSITIEVGQSKKEAHVCIVTGCTRGKRGYSNYCRKHKTMENVIQQKMEREKAIESLKNNNTIDVNESRRCRFGDCQKQRKGYSDFCREHKAIGKIIAGKIAREKAIAKIAERDLQNQNNENSPTLSLIECILETGRTHQIRVHMQHKGNNILGDKKYTKKFKKLKKRKRTHGFRARNSSVSGKQVLKSRRNKGRKSLTV